MQQREDRIVHLLVICCYYAPSINVHAPSENIQAESLCLSVISNVTYRLHFLNFPLVDKTKWTDPFAFERTSGLSFLDCYFFFDYNESGYGSLLFATIVC